MANEKDELIEKLVKMWYHNYEELSSDEKMTAIKHVVEKRVNSPELLAYLKKEHGLMTEQEFFKSIDESTLGKAITEKAKKDTEFRKFCGLMTKSEAISSDEILIGGLENYLGGEKVYIPTDEELKMLLKSDKYGRHTLMRLLFANVVQELKSRQAKETKKEEG